jgi:5-formyltetrahydrofolate cyclo-ligase
LHDKQELRRRLRQGRKAHVAGLPGATRALIFMRPPGAVAAAVPEGACVGLYHATGAEAPARGFARWFAENGRRIALPWFGAADGAMGFRVWTDPWDDSDLVVGPHGALQPAAEAGAVTPEVVIVPLLGFTADGHRLGQGGGHYDRWLAANPQVTPIGLAWDVQWLDSLPHEPHDRRLAAVVTPTRIYTGDA